jgi:hypothetical protein
MGNEAKPSINPDKTCQTEITIYQIHHDLIERTDDDGKGDKLHDL